MSINLLSKLFKTFILLFFVCLSCTKNQDKQVAVQVGDRVWSFQEMQDYFRSRLSSEFFGKQDLKTLKQEILNEILLILLIENWAKQQNFQIKKSSLNKEDKEFFLRHNSLLKPLKNHKNYMALYRLLLEYLFEKSPAPSLKKQRKFYNKNKNLFIEPPSCYLKQIVVKKERLARSLLKKLKQGNSFDSLSQLYSLKPHPGWIKQGSLDLFDRACFKSNKPLSPVLKSPYGYHIFLRGEKKKGKQKSFKQVQKKIIRIFKTRTAKGQFQQWLKEETAKTPVWTNKKLLDKMHIRYKKDNL